MPISLEELGQLSHRELATWVKPLVVDSDRADMMVEAAVEAVTEAVFPRTQVSVTAKGIVLEAAARAVRPNVQQESLGSRSVSFFSPSDPRSGVFLTEDELGRLGVMSQAVGVVWTRTKFGSVP